MLSNGSKGEDVTRLQKRLKKLGYKPGDVDGIFGPDTQAAVKRFQEANDLPADGIFGPNSLKAMKGAWKAYRAENADETDDDGGFSGSIMDMAKELEAKKASTPEDMAKERGF